MAVAQRDNVHILPPEPKMETLPGLTMGSEKFTLYPIGLTNAGLSAKAIFPKGSMVHIAAIRGADGQVLFINRSADLDTPCVTERGDIQEEITTQALNSVAMFPNARIRQDGLNVMHRLIKELGSRGAADLPAIQALTPEDGSLWIEWNSRHWRIGFTIETDPAESGWHLISDREHGDLRYSGDLASADIPWLVSWALTNLD